MENENLNPMPSASPAPMPTPSTSEVVPPTKKPFNTNKILIALAVLAVLVMAVLVYGYVAKIDVMSWFNLPMSKDAVAKKSVDYLNTNVLQPGQTAELGEVTQEHGVVKMQIKIGSSTYDSYATKDGKLFFPEAFDISGAK